MQSTVTDVQTYIDQAPAERREALTRLRQMCLDTLEGYEEVMEYGMPGYRKNGVGEISFASQKNYISLYVTKKDVVDAHRDELKGLSVGKGCIRYPRPSKMDFEVIQKLLDGTVKSDGQIC